MSDRIKLLPDYEVKDMVESLSAGQKSDWGRELVKAKDFYGKTKGKGVKVCVIDTGAPYNHPDLEGAIVDTFNAYENEYPLDRVGHGSAGPKSWVYTSAHGAQRFEDLWDLISKDNESFIDENNIEIINLKNLYTISMDNDSFKFKNKKIKRILKLPEKKVNIVNILTDNGTKISLTPWHKVYIYDGEDIVRKRADELTNSDWMIYPRNFELLSEKQFIDEEKTIEITEDVAWSIGFIIGDGTIVEKDYSKRILITTDKEIYLDKVYNTFSKYINSPKNIFSLKKMNAFRLQFTCKKLFYYFKKLNMVGNKCQTIFIPEEIIKSGNEILLSFLSGYFDADGNLAKNKPRMKFTTISGNMSSQLKFILSSIGICSQLRYFDSYKMEYKDKYGNKKISNCKEHYDIIIQGDDYTNFCNLIYNKSLKLNKIEECKRNTKIDKCPIKLEISFEWIKTIPVNLPHSNINKNCTRHYYKHKYMFGYENYYPCYKNIIKRINEIYLNNGNILLTSMQKQLDIFENIKLTKIKQINREIFNGYFYDFEIEDQNSNNYLSGEFGAVLISNTHVSGIIGARDNDIGTIGIAPECSLLMAKGLDDSGFGEWGRIAACIQWAVSKETDIINLSLGDPNEPPEIIKSAINWAASKGVLVVCAAGNDSNASFDHPTSKDVAYPAKYDECIAVAALDKKSKLAYFSHRGKSLDAVAPGVDIYSSYKNNNYAILSGTSQAAPIVSGILALLKSYQPDSIKNYKDAIRELQKISMNQEILAEYTGNYNVGVPTFANVSVQSLETEVECDVPAEIVEGLESFDFEWSGQKLISENQGIFWVG